MSATLGNVAVLPQRPHRPHRPRHDASSRRSSGPSRCTSSTARRRCTHSVEQLLAERQGADLPRPLHAEGRHRRGPELPRPRPAEPRPRRTTSDDGAPRLPLRHADRQGPAPVHHRRHRRPPRRAAPEVPAARREARPGRAAQDHLRHRHARRRHQRADPLGAVHAAVQVRRLERADPRRTATSPRSPGAPGARVSTTPATCGCRRRRTWSRTCATTRRPRRPARRA